MKKILLFVLVSTSLLATAQTDSAKMNSRKSLVIFAPLYLDSAFSPDGSPRFSGVNFPKYLLPGLEFVTGAQMAIDSLKALRIPLDIHIVDSKQKYRSLYSIVNDSKYANAGMIIAAATTQEELKTMADFAMAKNIPLISATYPNDGNVNKNPNMFILNTTLRGHVEAMYRYIQKNYGNQNIVLFKKTGIKEDRIKMMFDILNKQTTGIALKMKFVEVDDEVSDSLLKTQLDPINNNVVICGSMDERFGAKMATALSKVTDDSITNTLFGMPNWDGMSFSKAEYKGIDIIYTTPFNFNRGSGGLAAKVAQAYRDAKHSRASDMVLKGFETVLRFGKVLLNNNSTLLASVTDKKYRVFNDFELMPVRLSKNSSGPDFYENKKLFFVKKRDGSTLGIF
jgi:hypothetical protein